jgi:hypothetical protein
MEKILKWINHQLIQVNDRLDPIEGRRRKCLQSDRAARRHFRPQGGEIHSLPSVIKNFSQKNSLLTFF